MPKLLNIEEFNKFLSEFAEENALTFAFLATPAGGLICSNEFTNSRMVVEAISTVWQTFPDPNWERIMFEWESALCIVMNCNEYIFGIEQSDPNPSTLGLLKHKIAVAKNFIMKTLSEE
ncbi:hypothetical protein TVAG_422650 [Trichomonas vaginalis G3]|uniref:Roadblock/LAMTOR2 domain-containing protein n=1 Tax=Trichomonas vaginalis (strain ATCC PRA-98 / G3) TaxID=412133 RepID=A2G408_TRIV3|nr:dynein light chain 2a, cytoplasmic domain-containing protein [Trichomonas vaginalis G3]EAX88110.1 hypothetical protein TVAG_422650 [Trichomonas vaginalis G3]KAI5535207.1 dynein light chain 2a, cytoplasmic domain-containing protein [Trichomonas vaginalis G3]|eukprot:XP_001301040.1 hypothetical protein [Trichomonas vaginalis G3]